MFIIVAHTTAVLFGLENIDRATIDSIYMRFPYALCNHTFYTLICTHVRHTRVCYIYGAYVSQCQSAECIIFICYTNLFFYLYTARMCGKLLNEWNGVFMRPFLKYIVVCFTVMCTCYISNRRAAKLLKRHNCSAGWEINEIDVWGELVHNTSLSGSSRIAPLYK